MKTVLYYFTGTGNTLAVAQKLVNQLPEGELCPLIRNTVLTKIDSTAQKIGIIFPVYMWAVQATTFRG